MYVKFEDLEEKNAESKVRCITVSATRKEIDWGDMAKTLAKLQKVAYIFQDQDIEGSIRVSPFVQTRAVYMAKAGMLWLTQENEK